MAKENEEKSKSNIFNFRTESKDKTKEFRRRKKQLSNKASFQDVFEDGLLVNEGRQLEQTILNQKAKKIAKREEILTEFIRLNAEIQAHNLRLRDIGTGSNKTIDIADNVLYLKIYDKEGNEKYSFSYDSNILKS